jgi:hypothetical protein
MKNEFDEYVHDDSPQWRAPITWSALLLLGWLVYELTAMPALGAFVACFKFGWNDFLTARWLRRVDPSRPRGRTCFLLYVAAGLWKIALTGTLLMFGVLVWHVFQNPAPNNGPWIGPAAVQVLMGAWVATLLGFALSTLTTCIAVGRAWRHGVPLWLQTSMHKARKENVWPSLYPHLKRHRNKAGRLIKWALMVLVVAGSLMIPLMVQRRLRFLPFVLVFLALMPLAVAMFRAIRRNGLLAASPAACWGTEDPNLNPGWVDVAEDPGLRTAWVTKSEADA